MNRTLYLLVILLLITGTASAQTATLVIDRGNPQRTGVYATTPPAAPPDKLWQSDKLFVMTRQSIVSAGTQTDYSKGNPSWGYYPGRASIARYGFYYSNPVVSEGVIYFSLFLGDGYLFAVDATTGKLKWKSTRTQERYGPPAIAGNIMYVGSSGRYHAIDLNTRKELWNFPMGGHTSSGSAPLVANGLIFVGSSDGRLSALDAATGIRRWYLQADERTYWLAPVYREGVLYCVDGTGVIHALHAETGKELWKLSEVKGVFSLLLNGPSLFYVDFDGFIHSVDSSSGVPNTVFKEKPRGATHLAAFEDKVYFSGWKTGSIFAIDAKTGAKVWKFENLNECEEPAIAGRVLFVTCTDRKIYALDVTTGKKMWSKDTGQEVMSAPVLADGALYFLADDGKVHAIK